MFGVSESNYKKISSHELLLYVKKKNKKSPYLNFSLPLFPAIEKEKIKRKLLVKKEGLSKISPACMA